jgi:hypothetical protein
MIFFKFSNTSLTFHFEDDDVKHRINDIKYLDLSQNKVKMINLNFYHIFT